MPHFICTACGTQYAESDVAPGQCVICADDRQTVPPRGQPCTMPATIDDLAILDEIGEALKGKGIGA